MTLGSDDGPHAQTLAQRQAGPGMTGLMTPESPPMVPEGSAPMAHGAHSTIINHRSTSLSTSSTLVPPSQRPPASTGPTTIAPPPKRQRKDSKAGLSDLVSCFQINLGPRGRSHSTCSHSHSNSLSGPIAPLLPMSGPANAGHHHPHGHTPGHGSSGTKNVHGGASGHGSSNQGFDTTRNTSFTIVNQHKRQASMHQNTISTLKARRPCLQTAT